MKSLYVDEKAAKLCCAQLIFNYALFNFQLDMVIKLFFFFFFAPAAGKKWLRVTTIAMKTKTFEINGLKTSGERLWNAICCAIAHILFPWFESRYDSSTLKFTERNWKWKEVEERRNKINTFDNCRETLEERYCFVPVLPINDVIVMFERIFPLFAATATSLW